jgi:Na+/proline symporter
MNSDIMLVVGIILAVMSLPALIGALSEGEAPRAGAIVAMIATGLITFAIMSKPSGYAIGDIPEVFLRVIGRLIN